jgi:hypothetical protein
MVLYLNNFIYNREEFNNGYIEFKRFICIKCYSDALIRHSTNEIITIIQADEESAEIEIHCTKDFFVNSVIGLINHCKDEGIINKADLDYIFNATK